jgi:hypothetical protein
MVEALKQMAYKRLLRLSRLNAGGHLNWAAAAAAIQRNGGRLDVSHERAAQPERLPDWGAPAGIYYGDVVQELLIDFMF